MFFITVSSRILQIMIMSYLIIISFRLIVILLAKINAYLHNEIVKTKNVMKKKR